MTWYVNTSNTDETHNTNGRFKNMTQGNTVLGILDKITMEGLKPITNMLRHFLKKRSMFT